MNLRSVGLRYAAAPMLLVRWVDLKKLSLEEPSILLHQFKELT